MASNFIKTQKALNAQVAAFNEKSKAEQAARSEAQQQALNKNAEIAKKRAEQLKKAREAKAAKQAARQAEASQEQNASE